MHLDHARICALVARGAALLLALTSCRSGASGRARANMPAGGAGAPDAAPGPQIAVPLPNGGGGIGFDDLVFAPAIHKVLAPAAATGNLDLIDPVSMQVTAIGGFSSGSGRYLGGHGQGTTSADEGRGLLFAIDRTAGLLDVVDPNARTIVASATLGGGPDYVRWVDSTSEVWVTEPDAKVIEVFSMPRGVAPKPTHAVNIPVPGGPESLVIDPVRRKAFTHLWSGSTVMIDVPSHSLQVTWPNGCNGSRGIALDGPRGLLFAGCDEGKLVVLDVDHGGKMLASVASGSGVDVIAYNPTLQHVYVPGASSATMAIVGIATTGSATVLGTVPTARGAHCVTADDQGQAWVCDPDAGRLLVVRDPYAAGAPAPPPFPPSR